MPLPTGTRLGPYEILAPLGAGGMGEVYRARDTRLDRTIALKVLLADAVANPERKRRFIQEAKAASALNHPNIITIYDIGTSGSTDYIAMEYVPGRTLGQCIGRKGLGLNEALQYAIPIADALAKAHSAGIVHRDLKPANIMVNEDGLVKVLDFGLAKLTDRGEDSEYGATLSEGPRTEEGAIVGTVAYMSPEQAEGKKVDARSDIFSFGSVLYEMVTGRRPFHGETKFSTLTAIARDDPQPPSELAPEIPRDLEKIIHRCLRKDPGYRFQHMDDLKVALRELKEESDSGKLRPATPAAARSSRHFVPATAALLLVAAAAGWWLTRGRTPAAKPGLNLVLTRMTSDAGLTTDPALSPDGKLLAYASDRAGENNLDVWVQQVAGGAPLRLTSDPADESDPVFSPDGSKIAYHSRKEGGGIYIIPTLGGDARLVAKAPLGAGRFSPDGNWIAYHVGGGLRPSKIFIVSSGGGAPREVQLDIPWACCPVWAPDGKHLLVMGSTDPIGMGFDAWVAPWEGGRAVRTGATALLQRHGLSNSFAWSPPHWAGEHVFFSASSGDSTSLFRATISPRDWQIKDAPERLTTGTGIEVHPSAAPSPSGALRLAFASLTNNMGMWSLDVNSNQGKALGEPQRLTRTAAREHRPSLSADGRKLVFLSNRSGNQDVWIRDMQTGKESALAASPFFETHPHITPDGSKVAYAVQEKEKALLYVIPASGGVAEKICDDCGLPMHWSPDGKKIVYWWGQPVRYSVIDAATRERYDVLRHPKHNLHAFQFSPDGRWAAFHVPEAGRSALYVATLQPGGAPENEWIAMGDGSTIDTHPWWSPDGNRLYFLSLRDGFLCIWTQRLAADTRRPAGPPQEFYHFHGARRSIPEGAVGSGLSGDKLVFSMAESTGNIWMAVEK